MQRFRTNFRIRISFSMLSSWYAMSTMLRALQALGPGRRSWDFIKLLQQQRKSLQQFQLLLRPTLCPRCAASAIIFMKPQQRLPGPRAGRARIIVDSIVQHWKYCIRITFPEIDPAVSWHLAKSESESAYKAAGDNLTIASAYGNCLSRAVLPALKRTLKYITVILYFLAFLEADQCKGSQDTGRQKLVQQYALQLSALSWMSECRYGRRRRGRNLWEGEINEEYWYARKRMFNAKSNSGRAARPCMIELY